MQEKVASIFFHRPPIFPKIFCKVWAICVHLIIEGLIVEPSDGSVLSRLSVTNGWSTREVNSSMSYPSSQVMHSHRIISGKLHSPWTNARRLMAMFVVLSCSCVSVQAAATIVSVTPPPNGTYTTGATLFLRATYNVPVKVTGSPYLPVLVGTQIRNAAYSAGSGTKVLVFKLTVAAGDSSIRGLFGNNGIRLSKNLSIVYPSNSNIASIKGEQASLALLRHADPHLQLQFHRLRRSCRPCARLHRGCATGLHDPRLRKKQTVVAVSRGRCQQQARHRDFQECGYL